MKIAIIGLGLIGGSMAKAIKMTKGHEILGFDIQDKVMKKALLLESIDQELNDSELKECDLIIVALYPRAAAEYIKEKGRFIGSNSIVVDCCGVKENVGREIQAVASEYGFSYVGGHPMAGIEFSGFEYSKGNLFEKASMILTPPGDMDINITQKLKDFFLSIGFGHVEITGAKKHDSIIAYTSQLAHVVSNAYIKSPRAEQHKGFSAGSYMDLTRVAKLNPKMWTELFLENRENLSMEIDELVDRLCLYRDAIKNGQEEYLYKLLDEGTKRKIMLDE